MGLSRKLYQGATLTEKAPRTIITKLIDMKILSSSDEILAVYGSTLLGLPTDSIVLTASNFVVIDASGMFLKHNSYPYSGIGSISLANKGLLTYISLGIKGAGAVNIDISLAQDDAKILQDIVAEHIERFNTTSAPAGLQTDSATEIERYFDLMEKGVITEEEFNTKKKQLLGI